MIRVGTIEDFEDVIEIVSGFWLHTQFKDEEFCGDTTWAMLKHCEKDGLLSVVEIGGEIVGFGCSVKGGLVCNASIYQATELGWWVNPEHRGGRNAIALLKHMEGQAVKAGVKYFSMVYMETSMPDTVRGIYERMGYNKAETVYTKVMVCQE